MPIEILGNEIFTQVLTGVESLNITEDDGVGVISVFCSSSTAGTILGNATIDGRASQAISVTENNSVTISATSGKTLGTLTISAPSGCTLTIIANQG
jgi:hypothetical protein|tara:strand:- start:3320 stop:3610 length:291 start_codon:yes stop_codon:yes gene_type:complete